MINSFSKAALCSISYILSTSIEAVRAKVAATTHKPSCKEFYHEALYTDDGTAAWICSPILLVVVTVIGAALYHKYKNSNQNEEHKVDCIGEGVELQEILS